MKSIQLWVPDWAVLTQQVWLVYQSPVFRLWTVRSADPVLPPRGLSWLYEFCSAIIDECSSPAAEITALPHQRFPLRASRGLGKQCTRKSSEVAVRAPPAHTCTASHYMHDIRRTTQIGSCCHLWGRQRKEWGELNKSSIKSFLLSNASTWHEEQIIWRSSVFIKRLNPDQANPGYINALKRGSQSVQLLFSTEHEKYPIWAQIIKIHFFKWYMWVKFSLPLSWYGGAWKNSNTETYRFRRSAPIYFSKEWGAVRLYSACKDWFIFLLKRSQS